MPTNAAHYKSPVGYSTMMAHYDAALRRLSVPYESLTVPTRFGTTHLIATGPIDTQPLIFLHGWISNAMMWRPQLTRFSQTHRVYAIDTIGQAVRSAPVRPSFKGPGYAEWLVDVLDALGIEQASFVGSSGGGWLILKLATLAPERIAKAMLMSTAGIVPASVGIISRMLFFYLIPRRNNIRKFLRLMGSPNGKINEKMVEDFYVLFNHFKVLPIPPCLPDAALSMLTAPTFLLMGQYERIFKPKAVIQRANLLLPNIHAAEIVPNAGHIIQASAMNAYITRFLREIV